MNPEVTTEPTPGEDLVVEIITRWLLARTQAADLPRVNFRLVFGDERIARLTAAAMERHSDSRRQFYVRTSAAPDAVRLRHGRPADVPPEASVVYVLFWTPSLRGHELNAQSLSDLQSVDVGDVLGAIGELNLSTDTAILKQCAEAAVAWPPAQVPRAEEHLKRAWLALRACLCQRKGGREHSIPFVPRLDGYARFLLDALVPEGEWAAIAPADRPARLLTRWGRALPSLAMFSLHELASVLGVRTNVAEAVGTPKRNGEPGWTDVLATILGENIEQAVDFASLHDAIAGKRTLKEQLDELCPRVPLCRAPEGQEVARRTLEAFCHGGDEEALRQVEWLFLEKPENKRTASQGLKGLLMARGRRTPRANPLDVLASDTTQSLAKLVAQGQREAVEQYVSAQRVALGGTDATPPSVIEVLERLAEGAAPATTIDADLGPYFEAMAQSPGRRSEELRALATRWRSAVGKHVPDEKPLEASTVLLGVARLSAQRALSGPATEQDTLRVEGATAGDRLVLRLVQDPGAEECKPFENSVTKWDDDSIERLRGWIVTDVRRSIFEREEADGEREEEGSEGYEIDVSRKPAGAPPQPMGRIRVRWSPRAAVLWGEACSQVPQSWTVAPRNGESSVTESELATALRDLSRATPKPEATGPEALLQAWTEYAGESKVAGAAEASLTAPVSRRARQWVDRWSEAIAQVDAAASHQANARHLDDLNNRRSEAIREQNWAVVASLQAEIDAAPSAPSDGPAPKLHEVRSLLRVATIVVQSARGPVDRIALTPHHPLVIRLRAVGDRLLGEILARLWGVGWPANDRACRELNEQLADFELPEPQHAYGFWDGDPLTFEGWMPGPLAIFTRLGRDLDLDAASLGASEVAEVIERYRRLHPAAGDRLHLRLHGDERAHWAWAVLEERLDSPARRFSADVEVVTNLDLRERTHIDAEVVQRGRHVEAFEPGPEGTLPAVRVRRVRPDAEGRLPGGALHLSMLVGERIDAFRPHWDKSAPEGPPLTNDPWSTRVLFDEPRPVLSGYSFRIGDPADLLCRRVALAVGFASNAPGMTFHERYSFDDTRCEAPLIEHQGDAHWLVIASRQPVYRAVQQVGRRLATLLDFYTLTERGRPVHLCVSLNARRADGELARLQSSLGTLFGDATPPDGARRVLDTALRVAPGLAMRCAGANVATELEGLVGLLLTAETVAAAHPDAVILSLDQHLGLLGGRGARGDLLFVRRANGYVSVTVCEAKFSTAHVGAESPVLATARAQVGSTVERLRHLSLDHPLHARARNALLRAVGHQAHLTVMSSAQAALAEALLDDLRDLRIPVVVESARSGEVHVWSVARDAGDVVVEEGQTRAVIHGHESTVGLLKSLKRE